jgi:hypothetical protein
MGMKLFSDGVTTAPNPNPKRFKIEAVSVAKNKRSIVVVEATYPDCTTFEGRKIMVYEAPLARFAAVDELDPHFTEDDFSLLARFPATDSGLKDALDYADYKSKQD